MNIDIFKNIKKKNININKKYFNGNYPFHYFIMFDNLKELKKNNQPIFEYNNDNKNGFMLSASINNKDILKYLIKDYKEYIANTNSTGDNFLQYLDFNIDQTDILKLIPDCKFLLNYYNNDNYKPIFNIFASSNTKNIEYVINNKLYDIKKNEKNILFILVQNNSIKNKLNYLKKLNKFINYKNRYGFNLLFPAVYNSNINVIKYLIDNIQFDYYIPVNGTHIFNKVYDTDCFNEDFTISNLILDKIVEKHNYKETNNYGENLCMYVLYKYVNEGLGDLKIINKLLKYNTNFDLIDVNKVSMMDYILQIEPNDIKKSFHNKTIELSYKIDLPSNFSFIKINYIQNNELIIKDYKYAHTNMFKSTFLDLALFMNILDKKYPNLYVGKYVDNVLVNLNFDNSFYLPEKYLYFYMNFPWFIIINDYKNLYVHPDLNKIINDIRLDDKYDYAVCFVSYSRKNFLHAELIIYNFKENTIHRFDPYGNTILLDPFIDDILEEELTWNVPMTYIRMNEYMPVSGLQALSDENNDFNIKNGDFGGYCLAWSLFYLESVLQNPNVPINQLVYKLIRSIIKKDIKIVEYIRNYANDINIDRLKLIQQITGIDDKEISNIYFDESINKEIMDAIIKIFTI